MLVAKLSSHPKVLAWLATTGLIENFTVVTLNVSDGRHRSTHLRALAAHGSHFRVRSAGGVTLLDPASYTVTTITRPPSTGWTPQDGASVPSPSRAS